MTTYKPTTRCPKCSRCPTVRFNEQEVLRARRERQAAQVVNVQCPRCGTYYWIRARDIAAATPEKGSRKPKKKSEVDTGSRARIA